MDSPTILQDIELGKRTVRKLTRRLVPFLFVLYVISYLDRANIGYAALTMNEEIGVSAAAYGILTSIFYVGFMVFEVPSNIILHKIGARRWIARIMISWGLVSILTMFVVDVTTLGVARILLGVAEAGFFPGVILYLSTWFPERERAKTISLFMLGIPVANIIASPVSTWIMANIEWGGLAGWRWMFFWEAVPAVIMGVITIFFLTDKIDQAKWLSTEEKSWLEAELQRELAANKAKGAAGEASYKEAFKMPMVWRLSAIDFCYSLGGIALVFWLPTIVAGLAETLSLTSVGLVVMVPFVVGLAVMIPWGKHSDATNERRWHTAIPFLVAILGLVVIVASPSFVVQFVGICVLTIGLLAAYAPFWAMPTIFLTARAAAVGIAIIDTCANASGIVSNTVVGFVSESFGLTGIFVFIIAVSAIGFVVTITLPKGTVTSVRELARPGSAE